MGLIQLTALLALGAAAAQAQPPAVVQIQPSPDSAEQRRTLRSFTTCLAEARLAWARQTLSHPYLSQAQASEAADALNGRDGCVTGPETEVTFRTSGLVGSLAEHYVRRDISRTSPAALARTLSTLTPMNVSEDFALCVAAHNPAAARDLALSDPGSPAEEQAAQALGAHLGRCLNPGESPTVDLQSLRALVATALYRAVSTAARS